MDIMKKIYLKVLSICGLAGALLISGIAVGVTLDVVLRNFGVSWFSWIIEVAEYALYISTFLAAPWVLSQGGHIRVDLLVNGVPRQVEKGLDLLANLVGLSVCVVLFWSGWAVTAEAARLGSMIMKELVVVEWYLLWFVPASFFLMAIEFCRRISTTVSDFKSIESRS